MRFKFFFEKRLVNEFCLQISNFPKPTTPTRIQKNQNALKIENSYKPPYSKKELNEILCFYFKFIDTFNWQTCWYLLERSQFPNLFIGGEIHWIAFFVRILDGLIGGLRFLQMSQERSISLFLIFFLFCLNNFHNSINDLFWSNKIIFSIHNEEIFFRFEKGLQAPDIIFHHSI